MKELNYKFNEPQYIEEFIEWIEGTYDKNYHYGASNYQATEVIIDAGHGTGFNIGNIIKYAKRYGLKEGYNRKELLKIIHYALMQLYVHDRDKLGKEVREIYSATNTISVANTPEPELIRTGPLTGGVPIYYKPHSYNDWLPFDEIELHDFDKKNYYAIKYSDDTVWYPKGKGHKDFKDMEWVYSGVRDNY